LYGSPARILRSFASILLALRCSGPLRCTAGPEESFVCTKDSVLLFVVQAVIHPEFLGSVFTKYSKFLARMSSQELAQA